MDRMGIQGSRSLNSQKVFEIIENEIITHEPRHLVTSGGINGVCAIAQQVAKKAGIPITLHFLNFKYLRGAFEHRSKAVQADCEYCVFIHDGKSKGTTNELKIAKKTGIAHKYYDLGSEKPQKREIKRKSWDDRLDY